MKGGGSAHVDPASNPGPVTQRFSTLVGLQGPLGFRFPELPLHTQAHPLPDSGSFSRGWQLTPISHIPFTGSPVLSSMPVKAWIWALRSRKQAGDFLKGEWWAQTPSGCTGWGPAYLLKLAVQPPGQRPSSILLVVSCLPVERKFLA